MKRLSTLSYRIYNHCKSNREPNGFYVGTMKRIRDNFETKTAYIQKSLAELEQAKFIEDLTIENGKVKFYIIEN